MKTKRKVTIMMCLLWTILITGIAGCGKKGNIQEEQTEYSIYSNQIERSTEPDSGQIIKVETGTGDVFDITINNKKTNVLSYDQTANSISVCSDKGDLLQTGNFLSEKKYAEYYNVVIKNCNIIQEGEDANVRYIFYSYPSSGKSVVYEILGWIIGSNSGLVMKGNDDKDETLDIFTDLYFNVMETDQMNEYYIFSPPSN